MYFDKNGDAISRERFTDLFQDVAYSRVALTKLANGYTVSTIWIGIAMSNREGLPLIFETMISPTGKIRSCETRRYATLKAAELGHLAAVKEYENR